MGTTRSLAQLFGSLRNPNLTTKRRCHVKVEKDYYFLLLISFANVFFSVWSLEKLNNKIYDMRDLYNQCVEDGIPFSETVCLDVNVLSTGWVLK